MEIELKLLIDPDDVASFRRHPLLAQHAIAEPRVQRLTTTYFDTPDLFFRKHGAALRARRVARHWIQTLKAGGQAAAGLHQRHEWESRATGPRPDLAALRELVDLDAEWTRALSDAALADQLLPIFKTRFRRTIWLLRCDSNVEVELALDQGAVEHDVARVPVSEMELELKSGEPAKLFEFALELQASIPLRVSNVSKADRGFALYAPGPPAVLRVVPLQLSARTSVEVGLQAIVGNCLAQIQGNETGVVQGDDPESVHQMRVGVRRLRSALRLFDRVAPCPRALRGEVKWLAEILGAARDWEVMAGITLPGIEKACPAEAGLVPLRVAVQDQAKERRREAAAAVNSQRYSRLLLALGHWTQTTHTRESIPAAQQAALAALLEQSAPRMLKRWHAKLLKRGDGLQSLSPEARHQVRIVAKRVRYAAEFFSSLYPLRRMRPYVKTLVALQDELGRLNDAEVAAGLLRHLVQADTGFAESAGFVNGYLSSSALQGVRKLGKRWRAFQRSERPQTK